MSIHSAKGAETVVFAPGSRSNPLNHPNERKPAQDGPPIHWNLEGDAAHARTANDDQQDTFSRALDAVRFPGAEAAKRARRERAVTVRARLAALTDTDGRHQDELHRLSRTGAAPAARAEVLHQLAALREESAERHAELAHLEPETAGAHRAAAAQACDRAAYDREFAHLLAPQDTPAP